MTTTLRGGHGRPVRRTLAGRGSLAGLAAANLRRGCRDLRPGGWGRRFDFVEPADAPALGTGDDQEDIVQWVLAEIGDLVLLGTAVETHRELRLKLEIVRQEALDPAPLFQLQVKSPQIPRLMKPVPLGTVRQRLSIRQLLRHFHVEPAETIGFSFRTRPLRDGPPGCDPQIDIDDFGWFAVNGHKAQGRGGRFFRFPPPAAIGLDDARHGAGVVGGGIDLFPLRLGQPDRPFVKLQGGWIFGLCTAGLDRRQNGEE